MKRITLETKHGPLAGLSWPGNGPPVVVLHGLFGSSYSWSEFAERLHRPVIALDLPGFGMSPPAKEARIPYYSYVVSLALQNYPRYHLLGHSMGGAVAAYLAKDYPSRLRSLALLAPAGFDRSWSITVGRPLRKIFASFHSQLSSEKTLADISYAYFVTHNKIPDTLLLEELRRLGEVRKRGIKDAMLALSRANKKGALPENFYRGPTLALWGEEDPRIRSGHRKALAGLLPDARAITWKQVGHHPQHEAPERLQVLLENFWSGSQRRDREESSLA